jgi:regulation of enolase protein 1 (concanavalin A-like superfamily)
VHGTTVGLTVNAAGGGLPSGWLDADVGATSPAGSASYSSGVFTVMGGGADIWGTADQFNYAYQSASGDCTIVARVATVQNTATSAKAGVMIRETTAAGSAYAGCYITPSSGAKFEYRTSTGGSSASGGAQAGIAAPYWVKIARAGNTFTASISANGTSWTTLGSATITMAAGVDVGLPVCSHLSGTLCTATMDNVSVTTSGGDSNIAPSGTAYGWNSMTSSTANSPKTARAGLNDNNLTANVDLDSAGDSVNAWEAAGVTWSTAKTISSANFINGDITSGGDGFLTANCKLQFSADGSTWADSGWTISPKLGARVIGQVRTTDTSYHWIVKEVQIIGH